MKTWKKAMACLACVLAVSGCGAAPDGTAQAEDSILTQSDDFRQTEKDKVLLTVYADEESGVELQYSSDTEGEYRIVYDEQETFWEIGAVPEDIRDIRIQPWSEDGTFLVLTADLNDRTGSTFILNKEMMSQVFLQDPYAMAESCLDYTVVEESNIVLLGEEGFYIECEDREALTVIEKNLWISDEIGYGTDEGRFTCYFPVCVGPNGEIGRICLYYEYDGVGMNCVGTQFVSP